MSESLRPIKIKDMIFFINSAGTQIVMINQVSLFKNDEIWIKRKTMKGS